jgi:hypothetical protein
MSKFFLNTAKATGLFSAVALATIVFPMSANAVITVFTTQVAFQAAATTPYGNYVETFDSLNPAVTLASPQTFSNGGFSYTASVSTTSFFPAGTSGSDVWLSTNTATDTITLNNFAGGNVSAVGGNFFGTDISGLFATGDVTLTATDASGTVSQTINSATLTSFVGFISSGSFSSISIAAVQPTSGFLWPTVNNLYVGSAASSTAVPEPFTILGTLFGAGYGVTLKRKLVKGQQDKTDIN